jgi:hypothetical protein
VVDAWYMYGPIVIIVIALIVAFRWLMILSRRIAAYRDRIIYLEARVNGRSKKSQDDV